MKIILKTIEDSYFTVYFSKNVEVSTFYFHYHRNI